MVDFAPGMRTIIRDEEWMVKKIETNSLGKRNSFSNSSMQTATFGKRRTMSFAQPC